MSPQIYDRNTTVSRFCMEQIPFIFPTAREEPLVVILSHIASTPHFFTFYWVGRGSRHCLLPHLAFGPQIVRNWHALITHFR